MILKNLLIYFISLIVLVAIIGCDDDICKCPTDTNGDQIGPEQIFDLAVTDSSKYSLTLEWTAPADNDTVGTASNYYIGYYDAQTLYPGWEELFKLAPQFEPDTAGALETFTVTGLVPGSHYGFVIRSDDSLGNLSPLSNIAYGKTISLADSLIVGGRPSQVAVGDLDLNGFNDVVVSNFGSDLVSIFFNYGNKVFSEPRIIKLENGSSNVILEDFNNDGYLDIAVKVWLPYTTFVYYNDGNGNFYYEERSNLSHSGYALCSGDFNNDGYLDLVGGSFSPSGSCSFVLNNKDRTFSYPYSLTISDKIRDIKTSDFNSDGYDDIAIASEGSADLKIMMNNGDSTFAAPVSYPVASGASMLSLGDFDGDGDIDIAMACYQIYGDLVIFFNDGSGDFTQQDTYLNNQNIWGVKAVDLDNDTDLDLILTTLNNGKVMTMMNNGSGYFSDIYYVDIPANVYSLDAADLDNNGYLEILTTGEYNPNCGILYNLFEQ